MKNHPWHWVGEEPNTYYSVLANALMKYGTETAPIMSGPGGGRKTKELHPTTGFITKPRNRIVTSHNRVVNLPFALAEVIHILSGQNDAQALRYYNSQIIDIQGDPIPGWKPADEVDNDGSMDWRDHVSTFNAFYGERLRRFPILPMQPVDQLQHVVAALLDDRSSRQASIVLSHPWLDNFSRHTKDRACNVYAHAMIREDALDWMQIIRSNDAVWGIPYNLIQWGHVMEYVAKLLGVPMGNLFIVQDSYHVYENFYDECDSVSDFNIYDYLGGVPLALEASDSVLDCLVKYEKNIREGVIYTFLEWKGIDLQVGAYWGEVLRVLNSYSKYKKGENYSATLEAPGYFELYAPLMRMYVWNRWRKDTAQYGDLIDKVRRELIMSGMRGTEVNRWLGIG
jgi:thymidylate synthase